MNTNVAVAAASILPPAARAVTGLDGGVDRLISQLGTGDDTGGGRPAWQDAGPLGATAVSRLVEVMGDPEPEKARGARRALWNVVDYAGRPGGDAGRREVVAALGQALGKPGQRPGVARELLWMLGGLGDEGVVALVAARLGDQELRDDARCVLQRIPGEASMRALREALGRAPKEFAPALADALRARGEAIPGYPSRRLVPEKRTLVGA